MLTDLTIIEARVDYVTCSAPLGPDADVLAGIAARGLVDEQRRGERLRTGHMFDYEIARAGSWEYAQGRDGVFTRAGGTEAETWCRALLAVAHKCSRIDYCVTAQASNALDNPVPSTMRDLRERYANDPMQDSITSYAGLKRDRGISIGKRTSPYYGRIYDKTLESRGGYPRGCWRWEIELKRHASAFELAEYKLDPWRFEVAGALVARHFQRWNVETPASCGATIRMAKQIRRESDADRALKWLRRQVRPTIDWLFEIGRGDDVQRVLFSRLGIDKEAS